MCISLSKLLEADRQASGQYPMLTRSDDRAAFMVVTHAHSVVSQVILLRYNV